MYLHIYTSHLDRGRFLYIMYVPIKGAVGRSEDVAACYDGAPTVGGHLPWRHQAHLQWIMNIILCVCLQYLCPTCQGYSLTSVSTPPTILVRLLAWPQVQELVLPLEMVVAGGRVVVETGEGVVVEARNVTKISLPMS